MCDDVRNGICVICDECTNLIKEIEGYVWDPREAKKGYDEPLKENDHAIDALRYALMTHKVSSYDEIKQKHSPNEYFQSRFQPTRRI
jgi:phage terminase large subunit